MRNECNIMFGEKFRSADSFTEVGFGMFSSFAFDTVKHWKGNEESKKKQEYGTKNTAISINMPK